MPASPRMACSMPGAVGGGGRQISRYAVAVGLVCRDTTARVRTIPKVMAPSRSLAAVLRAIPGFSDSPRRPASAGMEFGGREMKPPRVTAATWAGSQNHARTMRSPQGCVFEPCCLEIAVRSARSGRVLRSSAQRGLVLLQFRRRRCSRRRGPRCQIWHRRSCNRAALGPTSNRILPHS